jgi:hypothetical protein
VIGYGAGSDLHSRLDALAASGGTQALYADTQAELATALDRVVELILAGG